MGAVAKNVISQLMPAARQPVPELFMEDSIRPMRIMGLKEAQGLSRFVAVLVLVPAGSADEGEATQRRENDSPVETSETSKLLEFFGSAMTQVKAKRTESFVFGDVKVRFASMEASFRGEPVMLTTLEFKTLKYLVENARRVISRDELLNEVWGYENYPCTRTVDNLILRLRKKLERDPARAVHFRTVRGAGYKFLP
jgi:DNA-binding winged helix-turn-helix (wHTH) protein